MKKLSIVLLLLALVLTVVPAAFAQDTLGASAEDFAAWTSANEATFSASTLSFDFTLTLGITGVDSEGGDMTANLTGSGAVINDESNPGVLLDVTGTAAQGSDSTPVNVGLRVVDGNIYLSEDGKSWQYSSLADFSSQLGGLLSGSGVPVDPSTLSGDLSSMESMGGMSDMMAGFENMQPSDFLTLTRDGDAYTLDLDISKLLASPALAPMLAGAMGGGSSTQMTDAQQKQMAQMMAAMFSTATFQLTQKVDSSSEMVTSTALDISIPLDIVAPGAGITVNFALNLSGFGDPVEIVAPEGATPMSS
ncbi:MAG: hypothetical protein U0521_14470 [Anaerolineae bacterium]